MLPQLATDQIKELEHVLQLLSRLRQNMDTKQSPLVSVASLLHVRDFTVVEAS